MYTVNLPKYYEFNDCEAESHGLSITLDVSAQTQRISYIPLGLREPFGFYVGLGYRQQWRRSRLGILMLCWSLNRPALGYPRHLQAYPEEIIDILIICLK
ncbi:hypothetical protein H6F77_09040 [Microcoleus sp. FACHB-831]|uniref:hypothetical protein n=1 Tax=Microcoleus sp. FACHB-831 TaxID=2692827 RepID=UPI001686D551|nr:hypothetical protein [Microcoleus sp. FACHB-831]MBD1921236.1 hypothetical protein [Microcoleus sp. FACHB-831]